VSAWGFPLRGKRGERGSGEKAGSRQYAVGSKEGKDKKSDVKGQKSDLRHVAAGYGTKSPYESQDIWENRQEPGQEYDYRKLGIIGEPYFDIDYDQVFYLTDTGRRWDSWKVSVRDKDVGKRRSGF